MDQIKTGKFLASLRLDEGLTQEQLAGRLKVTKEEVNNWEVGETKPDIDTLLNLAKIYNITVDEIVSGVKREPKTVATVAGNFLQRFTNEHLFQFGKAIACFFVLISFFLPYYFYTANLWNVPFSVVLTLFNLLTTGNALLIIGAWLLFLGTIALSVYSTFKVLEVFGKANLLTKLFDKNTLHYIILGVLGACGLGEIFILVNAIAIGFFFSLIFLAGFGYIYFMEMKMNK